MLVFFDTFEDLVKTFEDATNDLTLVFFDSM